MTEFWLLASAMLLIALAIVLLPVLRVRKSQAEEDRTALNVASYQEHLAELDAQLKAGSLTQEQYQTSTTEASRELLNETEAVKRSTTPLGIGLPLVLALLVPILALGFYYKWGAQQAVALTLEFKELSDDQVQSIEQRIDRLERLVDVQPYLLEAWYSLGRLYLQKGELAKAANAFQYVLDNLEERPVDVLVEWAQAEYFANGKQWTAKLQQAADDVFKQAPDDASMLGLIGIAAYEAGDFQTAIDAWSAVVKGLPANSNGVEDIAIGIERAKQALAANPIIAEAKVGTVLPKLPAKSLGSNLVSELAIQVSVDLAPEIKTQVEATDTVFIFARAQTGPPMPLAAKRVAVADLPVKVSLTVSDAMMANMTIAQFPDLELQARISRSGIATEGQWQSLAKAAKNDSKEQFTLFIDQPM